MRIPFLKSLLGSLLFAASLVPLSAIGQSYPGKSVKIIVPGQAGGPSDLVGRYYVNLLSKELGHSFYIENRLGSGGNIGTAFAARAPADGYTLVIGNSATHAMNLALYSNAGYDPEKDFVPVGMLGYTSLAIAVSPKLGVRTFAELIAKSKTDKLNIALPSTTATIIHDILVKQGGSAMLGVPFTGAPAAITALLGGHVDAIIDSASSVQQYVTAGTMVPLV